MKNIIENVKRIVKKIVIGAIVIVALLAAVLIGGKALFTRPKQPEYIILPAYTSVYEIEETGQAQIAFPVNIQALAFDASKTHLRIRVDTNNQTYTGWVEKGNLEKRAETAREEAPEGSDVWSKVRYFLILIVIAVIFFGFWAAESFLAAVRSAPEPRRADFTFLNLEGTSGSLRITLQYSFEEERDKGRELNFFQRLRRILKVPFITRPSEKLLDFIERKARELARTASSSGEIARVENLDRDPTFMTEVRERATELGIVVAFLMIEVVLSEAAREVLKKLAETDDLAQRAVIACHRLGYSPGDARGVDVLRIFVERSQSDAKGFQLRALGTLAERVATILDVIIEGGVLSLLPRMLRGGMHRVDETEL